MNLSFPSIRLTLSYYKHPSFQIEISFLGYIRKWVASQTPKWQIVKDSKDILKWTKDINLDYPYRWCALVESHMQFLCEQSGLLGIFLRDGGERSKSAGSNFLQLFLQVWHIFLVLPGWRNLIFLPFQCTRVICLPSSAFHLLYYGDLLTPKET